MYIKFYVNSSQLKSNLFMINIVGVLKITHINKHIWISISPNQNIETLIHKQECLFRCTYILYFQYNDNMQIQLLGILPIFRTMYFNLFSISSLLYCRNVLKFNKFMKYQKLIWTCMLHWKHLYRIIHEMIFCDLLCSITIVLYN